MDKTKSFRIALVSLIIVLVFLLLIFPATETSSFKGSSIGKLHSTIQEYLAKNIDSITGSAVNVQESTSSSIYPVIILILTITIFALIKKRY